MFDELLFSGHLVDESTMILALIRALGHQYNHLMLTVHANLSNLALDDVISQPRIFDNILIAQEGQTSDQLPPNANVTWSNISQTNNREKLNSNQGYRGCGKQNQYNNAPRCQICSRYGHMAINCRERYNKNFQPQWSTIKTHSPT